jgi:hypothetical protein
LPHPFSSFNAPQPVPGDLANIKLGKFRFLERSIRWVKGNRLRLIFPKHVPGPNAFDER